jgi:ABC-type uncharacterized transport system involved in gliding motility auxiliary subunit
MQKKFASITALVVILVIVVGINLIGSLLFKSVKLDATEGKLFTLSAGSRRIAASPSLPEHVSAKFFFSKTAVSGNPMLRDYAGRVVDMLREFQAASKGRIALELIDPRPDTAEEEAAERSGLQAVPLEGIEGSLFLGLVVRDNENPDQVVTVPFFDPSKENLLEYEISKALYSVAHPEKKKVGILSSLPVMGGAPQNANPMAPPQPGQKPWYFVQQLKENFDVMEVSPTATELPKGLDLLLVVHLKKLSQAMEYQIDQFLLAGGSVVAFVDPLCDTDMMATRQAAGGNMQMMMQSDFDSNLPELFKAWGLELVSGEATAQMGKGGPSAKVVADPNLGEMVGSNDGGSEKMIVWLGLGKEQMDARSIITSELSHVTMVMPGALRRTAEQEGVKAEVLMETTPEAATMDSTMLKLGGADPVSLRQGFKPGSSKLALAYQLTGNFKTAFPGGKPAAEGEAAAAAGGDQLTESKTPGTVVVVADVDMLADRYSVRVQNFFGRQMASPLNDNLSFVSNVAENLSGSKDLIALRSRGRSQRPFTRVQTMLKKKEADAIAEENKYTQEINAAAQSLNELAAATKDTRILDAELAKKQKQLKESQIVARGKLRETKRSLREDVESMGRVLVFVNIALMPLLVIGVGLGVAAVRVARRRRRNG